jgi:hypothetical protein
MMNAYKGKSIRDRESLSSSKKDLTFCNLWISKNP